MTIEELVRGPFSEEEVLAQLDAGLLPKQALLWGPHLSHWVSASDWQKLHSQTDSSSSHLPGDLSWYFASKGQTQGPFEWGDLIQRLRLLGNDAAQALLWTKGMKSWLSVFEFAEVLNELQMSQRTSDRIEVIGRVRLQIGNLEFLGDLESLSVGGFGAHNINGLTHGNQVTAILTSELWNHPINVRAEVRYTTPAGSVGFKFTSLNREDSSRIQNLVKLARGKKRSFSEAA